MTGAHGPEYERTGGKGDLVDRQQPDTRAWVLHGHGTGALKRSVREALSNSRYVQRYAAAESDDGGDACTFIELGTPTL